MGRESEPDTGPDRLANGTDQGTGRDGIGQYGQWAGSVIAESILRVAAKRAIGRPGGGRGGRGA